MLELSTTPQPTEQPAGFSGRRLTSILVLALVVVGVGMSFLLWNYNSVRQSRDATLQAWRVLVGQLDTRYRMAEITISKGVDDTSVDMALGERFRLALDRFRTTSQPTLQLNGAIELEELVVQSAVPLPPTTELLSAIDAYNAQLDAHGRVLDSPGGTAISTILSFERPAAFAIGTPNQLTSQITPK